MENIKMEKSPAKGIKLLCTAGILLIVSSVALVIGLIVLAVGAVMGVETGDPSGDLGVIAAAIGGMGPGGLIMLISGIIMVISGIMQFVALLKNSELHASYKTALILVVISVAMQIVTNFVPIKSDIVLSILGTIVVAVSFMVAYFVISATVDFLNRKDNKELADKGLSVRKLYMLCTAVIVVTELLALIPALEGVLSIILMVAYVVQIVALFKYIGFLGKSSKALEN